MRRARPAISVESRVVTIAYRDTPALCPICAARMEEQPIEGGTIRTCESCGGVWVDGGGSDLAQAATQAHVPAAPHRGASCCGILSIALVWIGVVLVMFTLEQSTFKPCVT